MTDPSAMTTTLAQELSAAVLTGHFCLSSGRHSDRFIQKFRLLEDPRRVVLVVNALLERLAPLTATIVMSAAVGGIVLGYEAARQLGSLAIFVEKEGGKPMLRRGFQLSSDDRVLVVEDVVTTGGSVKEVLELVRSCGATVEALGMIVQRAQVDFGVRTVALIDMPLDSYAPEDCPSCAQGLALQDPGSRRLDLSR